MDDFEEIVELGYQHAKEHLKDWPSRPSELGSSH
jgi:hypothetical protein